MKILRIVMAFGLAVFLGGCAKLGLFAANAPAHLSSDITASKDIIFDEANNLALDIYAPARAQDKPSPVVIFYYGGKWQSGSRTEYAFVAHALTQRGFVVVIPDYRQYPAVKFPAFVDDAAKAVAWVYDHIANYGGDPSRIAVAGHSAGAHIAALVATDPSYLKTQGKNRNIIKAFAGLAGPYAFTPEEADLKDIFGPPTRYKLMQVPNFIDGHQPPMLLLHGADDTTVGIFNVHELEKAILKKGGHVETRVYKGVDHVWIAGALSWLGSSRAPALDDMTRFFNSVM
ncbi:MAG: alpha/beta hydrolase [Proteobacteria bacterium]|nr:alpha/beta hydrolase [Pseudomonadota bacterium]